MKGIKFAIYPILLVLLAFATMAICVSVNVAFAEELPLSFKLSADNDKNWTLYRDDAQIGEYTGEFFVTAGVGVSAPVSDKIKEVLLEEGRQIDDYVLTFEFPEISAFIEGAATMEYSEIRGQILIKANYLPVISQSTMTKRLVYSSLGDVEIIAESEEASDGLLFGKNTDAGEYDVSFTVTESFSFGVAPDGASGNLASEGDPAADYRRQYDVVRRSNSVHCTIEKADPIVPTIDTIEAEYGTRVKDIRVPGSLDDSGEWTLLEEQNTDSIFAEVTNPGEVFLPVAEREYTLDMLYTPKNTNYKEANATVKVRITPKEIIAIIDDASSLCHEPLKSGDELTFDKVALENQLVANDTFDMLHLSLYVENGDPDTPGYYTIKAKIENENYVVTSRNRSNYFVEGGRYIVFATSFIVVADDGMEFEVFIVSDKLTIEVKSAKFREKRPSAKIIDGTAVPISAYKFVFYENGRETHPTEFGVSWKHAPKGTKAVAHYVEDELNFADGNSVNLIYLSKEGVYNDTLYFYGVNILTGYNIMLLVILSLAIVGIAILTALLIAGRK